MERGCEVVLCVELMQEKRATLGGWQLVKTTGPMREEITQEEK